jgi:adenine-specific DNA-methyltransferase
MKGEKGLLIHGDNFDALHHLKKDFRGRVTLIYIDPPYGTKQTFTISGDRFATISRANHGKVAYSDQLTGDDYLQFLAERLALMRELLSDDGSIYVHIDSKMGHYVKIVMDKIFGPKNFINDITRVKCNPKNFSRKGYGNVKDMILFYSKSKNYVWNHPRKSIKIGEDDIRFRSIDADGRRYTTTPLHAPGETANGATGKAWRGMSPPVGRHWRYPPAVLDELDTKGLIEWSSTGNPRKKIFADDVMKAGVKMQDIWIFKDPQNAKYPTEKNLDMLKMIVEASSNPGDIVLDAFCGSGTTLVAAQNLQRRWIGIDASPGAIAICNKRLLDFGFSISAAALHGLETSGAHFFDSAER